MMQNSLILYESSISPLLDMTEVFFVSMPEQQQSVPVSHTIHNAVQECTTPP